jgi:kynurenine formamidase
MSDAAANFSLKEWIWLSHALSEDTPAYAGGIGLQVFSEKCISSGDSCNASKLTLSNHLGSHVDAPRHFIPEGLTVDAYQPNDWIFSSPLLVDISIKVPELISIDHLSPLLLKDVDACDLLLIRTGFELSRSKRCYWESGPGLHPHLANWLQSKLPNLRAIGIDWISVSSFQHREMGRSAHVALLGAGWRLFEDLALAAVPCDAIESVIALPLRLEGGDGAPCTIIASISKGL